MHPDRLQDVVDKQRVSLVGWLREGSTKLPSLEMVASAAPAPRSGLLTKVTNARRVGVVSDRVQRCTRQIKMYRVIGLVEENGRISFQVYENDLTNPQVVHRRLLAVLPIFMTWKIAE